MFPKAKAAPKSETAFAFYMGREGDGLLVAAVEQRLEGVPVLFKDLEEIGVSVPCVLFGVAEDVVLLAVVYNVESRHCLAGTIDSICDSVR